MKWLFMPLMSLALSTVRLMARMPPTPLNVKPN